MATPSNVLTAGTGAFGSSVTSGTYTVAAGNDKRLVVVLGLWSATSTLLATSPTVTHNGVAMTLRSTSQSNNNGGGNSSNSTILVFDLILGSTTPSGAIVASWTNANRSLLIAFTIDDIAQSGAPTIAASQSLGPDSVASATTDTVFDVALNAAQNTTTGYALTVGSGQTSLSNRRVLAATGNEGNLGASWIAAGTPTTALQWSGNASLAPRQQHVVVGYAQAATGNAANVAATEDDDIMAAASGAIVEASIAAVEADDVMVAASGSVVESSVAATEADDTMAASAGPVSSANTAAVASVEADDAMAALAGPVNGAAVAAVEDPDAMAASVGTPFADVPIGGAAWLRPKKPRKVESVAEVLAAEMPIVEAPRIKPTPLPVPKFDATAAVQAAREAARSAAQEEVVLRRTERRLAAVAVAQARARAKAQAEALAKAEADEEDDIEALLLGAW